MGQSLLSIHINNTLARTATTEMVLVSRAANLQQAVIYKLPHLFNVGMPRPQSLFLPTPGDPKPEKVRFACNTDCSELARRRRPLARQETPPERIITQTLRSIAFARVALGRVSHPRPLARRSHRPEVRARHGKDIRCCNWTILHQPTLRGQNASSPSCRGISGV